MQVQIQRGSPLKQSESELSEICWYNIEGGRMLEWKQTLEADISGFKSLFYHFRQLLNLPEEGLVSLSVAWGHHQLFHGVVSISAHIFFTLLFYCYSPLDKFS